MKYKSLLIKYAICIPVMILSGILVVLGGKGIIPRFWAYTAIIAVHICIIVLMTEMSFFAPRDDDKDDTKK